MEAPDAPERASCTNTNLQGFLQQYGLTAVLVYTSISAGTFAAIYSALLWGLDVTPLLKRFGMSSVAADGTIAMIAFALTKLLVPVKVPLAVYIVVQISKRRATHRKDETELSSLLDEEEHFSDCGEDDDDDGGDGPNTMRV